jgi:hypothetical protein
MENLIFKKYHYTFCMQKKYLTSEEAKGIGHMFVDMEAKKLQSRLSKKSKRNELYA